MPLASTTSPPRKSRNSVVTTPGGQEEKSYGCAEGWVGWPYVACCSTLFASGSVDSSYVRSVPGWAAMSLTSDLHI